MPKWLGDGANSAVTFVNLHLPSSKERPLTLQSRLLHFQAAAELAAFEGSPGIIMGDLSTNGQDRRPPPRQDKTAFGKQCSGLSVTSSFPKKFGKPGLT